MSRFRRIFNPTPEEIAEKEAWRKKLFDEVAKDKGCVSCANTKHVRTYPDFVTGEENECTAGLKCDTVLHTVKNCPKWERWNEKT